MNDSETQALANDFVQVLKDAKPIDPKAMALHTLFSMPIFAQAREVINTTGRGFILRPNGNDPVGLSTAEVEAILHEHAPELSATVSGPTIVIFHDKTTENV